MAVIENSVRINQSTEDEAVFPIVFRALKRAEKQNMLYIKNILEKAGVGSSSAPSSEGS